jgi:peptidoglycan hydrolase-like protein with peptidoglycan-binding domain
LLRLLVASLIVAGSCSLSNGQDYGVPTVIAAQEALTRLGYDIGTADGKWGNKTNAAMNALRQEHGLSPAKLLTGSSLALVHQLSPGASTLPRAGILIADPILRRTAIADMAVTDEYFALCQGPAGAGGEELTEYLKGAPPARVTTSADPALGYITQQDDWYTPVVHAILGAHNSCIKGSDLQCQTVANFVSKWAEADALKPGAKPGQHEFNDISWIGNTLLRNMIFAYADARRLAKIDAQQDAANLDWLKRRVDEYHYIAGEVSNHTLSNMMPAMAFGAMIGDRSMMEDAFQNYRDVLDTMRDDGSLPAETRRGARALQYTNTQVSQLLATEEVARMQGIDLTVEDGGKALKKTITFVIDAFENFDKVTSYAKVNDGAGPSKNYKLPALGPWTLGWWPAYYARFGNDENISRMATVKLDLRGCSPESLAEEKVPSEACTDGPPTLPKLLSVWETSDMQYMGYSAFCLQGVAPDSSPLR